MVGQKVVGHDHCGSCPVKLDRYISGMLYGKSILPCLTRYVKSKPPFWVDATCLP